MLVSSGSHLALELRTLARSEAANDVTYRRLEARPRASKVTRGFAVDQRRQVRQVVWHGDAG